LAFAAYREHFGSRSDRETDCCRARENLASARIIQACGGVLENEVPDTIGLTRSGIVQRYWINL